MRAWIEETQKAERLATGEEPTKIPDLLDRLLDAATGVIPLLGATPGAEGPSIDSRTGAYPYARANEDYHRQLEDILVSGDDLMIEAVVPNLRAFSKRLQPLRKPSAGKRRAAVNE